MFKSRLTRLILTVFITSLFSSASNAASVYFDPATSNANLTDGTATVGLWMDFSDDPTAGGGIDIKLSGPISFSDFAPSDYFQTLNVLPGQDLDLTDYGTEKADNAFEIHFGDLGFGGLTGVNHLGDITVNLLGAGIGTLDLLINSIYGGFYSSSISEVRLINVDLKSASIATTVVPLPAAVWLFASALGLLGIGARKSTMAKNSLSPV